RARQNLQIEEDSKIAEGVKSDCDEESEPQTGGSCPEKDEQKTDAEQGAPCAAKRSGSGRRQLHRLARIPQRPDGIRPPQHGQDSPNGRAGCGGARRRRGNQARGSRGQHARSQPFSGRGALTSRTEVQAGRTVTLTIRRRTAVVAVTALFGCVSSAP